MILDHVKIGCRHQQPCNPVHLDHPLLQCELEGRGIKESARAAILSVPWCAGTSVTSTLIVDVWVHPLAKANTSDSILARPTCFQK